MNDAKTKSQIVEKITSSTNVLVTVSNDPSVDALSAAIALTLILNKLNKHTTAIFSGQAPPAITFLDPQSTFETSIDSLRDFIIALDKEKADHLRYKVDGDVVKIFITPYRTTISSDDLEFSQGDYNVELVLALGVENQAHLDMALEAHGSILHDATVITISTGEGSSSLGSIDWRDEAASSLSEMIVGLSESLQSDVPLLDQQVATALLTGIVAETDRFSNPKTSSKVMTMAAQLMAAGADQQLIASKLQESHEIGNEASSSANEPISVAPPPQPTPPIKEGMAISHDQPPVVAPPTPPVPPADPEPEPIVPPVFTPPAEPEQALASAYSLPQTDATAAAPTSPTPVSDVPSPAYAPPAETPAPAESPLIGKLADAYALEPASAAPTAPVAPTTAPLLGGMPPAPAPAPASAPPPEPSLPTAAATSPYAPPATPPSEEISKHSYLGSPTSSFDNSVSGPLTHEAAPSVDIFSTPPAAPDMPASQPTVPTDPLMAPPEKSRDEATRDDALAAVNAAYSGTGSTPTPAAFSPAPGIVLPPPPPLPDFSALPSPAASPFTLGTEPQQPERLGDILAPPPPVSNDPGQFKIPGQ